MSTTSAASPPQVVVTAFRLYLVGAVLGLVGAVVIAVLIPASIASARSEAVAALRNQPTSTLTADQVVGIAVGVSVASIVLSIVWAVLIWVLAPRMRRGGRRARIALVIIAAVQAVGLLGSYGVGAVHFLVVAAAAVLTLLPSASAWFRAGRRVGPLA